MSEAKPFGISKALIWEAWQRVKANKGAAGIDNQSIAMFEADERKQLYRIWNRMSSGSYFPPAVMSVSIPKKTGGVRVLGIPTVADRVAQTAVTLVLEPILEPVFHQDSYGYRQKKSAHDALSVTRKRCWKYDWVLEYDIRGLFDHINHEKLLKALRYHCNERWVLLLVERWLTAPMQSKDGNQQPRTVGTPQGGPLSPVLANLFLHYALDSWLSRNYPEVPFCRYADDGILHCRTEAEAKQMLLHLQARLKECGLEIHPQKTRIVYCKDAYRKEDSENTEFDFLGYTFRPRSSRTRSGRLFVSFSPAISRESAKAIRQKIRRWKIHRRSYASLHDLAKFCGVVIRGWMYYYCRFYRSAFQKLARYLDEVLLRWAMRKFKRLKGHRRRAQQWLSAKRRIEPLLFPHWCFIYRERLV